MLGHRGALGVHAVKDDLSITELGHFHHLRIGGVKHGGTGWQDHIDLGARDLEGLLGVLNVIVFQGFLPAHIGNHADRAFVVGQAFAQDSGAGVFEHGGLDAAVDQQALARVPIRGIDGGYLAAIKEQAFTTGEAHMLATDVHQPGDQAGNARSAQCAGDPNDRNASVALAVEQMLNDGLANRLARTVGGPDMGQQAGAGVNFNHRAALATQRLGDVFQHHVHARNVQAHYAGGQCSGSGHAGVHGFGHVKSHIAVALDQYLLPCGGNRLGGQPGALQLQNDFARAAGHQRVQRRVFIGAPARVGVDLQIGQLVDVGFAVAGDPELFATRSGHHLAAYHQQTVFVAGDKFFDDDAAATALAVGQRVGFFYILLRHQVQRHAAAVVAVVGLQHHGHADLLRGRPRSFGALHQLALRHRYTTGLQQGLGQVLVAGDFFGNRAGLVGLRGPDAALCVAVAQLHQVACGQANMGNAA